MDKENQKTYFKYWGKARKTENGNIEYHPLVYHSLDVAVVAGEWWEKSKAIRNSFIQETGFSERQAKAWVQFFIALHDIGKIDIRFQNKVPTISPYKSVQVDTQNYDHGSGGYMWFVQEGQDIFNSYSILQKRYMQNWMAHTAGHHGAIPSVIPNPLPSYLPQEVKNQDFLARKQFIQDLANLFLDTEGGVFKNINLSENPPVLLAGFCSVCDWVGSHTNYFEYVKTKEINSVQQDLSLWMKLRSKNACKALKEFGFLTKVVTSGGMDQIYPDLKPINIQTFVSYLNATPGLVIMEADTGSGKTEAAIAFASRLLAKGHADSITFALPTQATANAILPRLTSASNKIFKAGQNVILAHGRSPYNEDFKQLIKNSSQQVFAKGNKAGAQCHEWLSLSRKRAFLGQIAVTTVDQVMLSAIKSLKHHFVRAFGIGKSVLIIDEVHAYDSYMYGILKQVIKQQKQAGGSVILLSATLPRYQKRKILEIWSNTGAEDMAETEDYPLVLQVSKVKQGNKKQMKDLAHTFTLQKTKNTKVTSIELWLSNDMHLGEDNLKNIAKAVKDKKAKVGVICNLVDDAQAIAEKLKEKEIVSDIFHSRYRYKDRMKKEETVIVRYGKNSRISSSLLVGTQVLEQSLDIDFDWLITFLCPVDLLFQRMGRLHRHLKERPKGFENPLCSIVLPEKSQQDYGLHSKYIYHNKRALWRTQQLLYRKRTLNQGIAFPQAYRTWIEQVYKEEVWRHEPEKITKAFEKYKQSSIASESTARHLTIIKTSFSDTEGNVATLTREGEMNLTVVPIIKRNGVDWFLDGESQVPTSKEKNKQQWEELCQNSVAVPASWEHFIPGELQNGLYFLTMQREGDKNWVSDKHKGVCFHYNIEYGLQKIKTDT